MSLGAQGLDGLAQAASAIHLAGGLVTVHLDVQSDHGNGVWPADMPGQALEDFRADLGGNFWQLAFTHGVPHRLWQRMQSRELRP